MSFSKSTTAFSKAAAIALAAGLVTVPQANAQTATTTDMTVIMGCNVQIKQGDVPRIFRGLIAGAEGVYNGGTEKYDMIRFSPKVTAPAEIEQGKQFDYVINLGKVGAPDQIAVASVQSADQFNVWIDLPKNATLDEVVLSGGDQNVTYAYDKANNRIRFFKEGAADVSKWTEAGESQWVHGGLAAKRDGNLFVVDFPQVTLKLTPTGAPGETVAPSLDETDPKEFSSKAFAQLYANANAVGVNANALVRCGLGEKDSTPNNGAANAKSDRFPAVKIVEAKKTEAEINNPTAKAPVTIKKGDALPNAKAQLNNVPANATAEWTTKHPEIGENQAGAIKVTYSDGSTDEVKINVTVIRAETQADKFNPEAITDPKPIYYQTDELPAARESVKDPQNLPAGTKFEWKYPANKIGENLTGTIVITYPDGSKDEVTRPVAVRAKRTQAEENDPQPVLDPRLEWELDSPKPPAKDHIKDFGSLPAGTTAEWTSETGKIGPNLTGIITVTYPDGSQDEVRLPVDVLAPWAPQPQANPTVVAVGSEVADGDAKDQIANASLAPENTTFTWKTKPNTSEAGDVTGVVTVKAPGKETVDVEVHYSVVTDVNAWRPEITTEVQEVEKGDEISDEAARELVTNLEAEGAPNDVEVAWKTKPDTSKAGEVAGVITITADGKTVERTVRYRVTETYAPQAKEDLKIEIGTQASDDAASAIANVQGAPFGTKYEWVEKPDTSKVGKTTAVVKVSTPGENDTFVPVDVEVVYEVISDFEPKKNVTPTDVVYGTDTANWGEEEAASQIQNRVEAPEGTKFEWVIKPTTDASGKQTGKIKVTVPGHTPAENKVIEVDVEINVVDAPSEAKPFVAEPATGLSAKQGHLVREIHARESIANKDEAPEGTTFTWETKPDTQQVGPHTGVVIVKVPGQDEQKVTINYTIEERKVEETPTPETPTPENPTPENPTPENPQPTGEDKLVVVGENGTRFFEEGQKLSLLSKDGQYIDVIADSNGAFQIPEGLADKQVLTVDGSVYTIDLADKTFKKEMTTPQVAGIVIGSVLGSIGLLGSVVQLSGIAKFNTAVQKQLGIYNPQIAAQVEQAAPIISGLLGLAGLGLVIGLLVPKSSDSKATFKIGAEEFTFKGYTFPKNK